MTMHPSYYAVQGGVQLGITGTPKIAARHKSERERARGGLFAGRSLERILLTAHAEKSHTRSPRKDNAERHTKIETSQIMEPC